MKLYQVDAFAEKQFFGNPAAVCILDDEWPADELMQKIAEENALPETAFLLRRNGEYHIRWFAPCSEIFLCGHATLATGHVMFHHEGYAQEELVLHSNRGRLSVKKEGELLTLDFPLCELEEIDYDPLFDHCFNSKPVEVYKANADIMFVYERESDIHNLVPNLSEIAKLSPLEGVIATARGESVDFVSRVFAPQVGIDEDPVTGSAHTAFAPYWSRILKKNKLVARQLSKRGGQLVCEVAGDRVLISGRAVTYLNGEIFING